MKILFSRILYRYFPLNNFSLILVNPYLFVFNKILLVFFVSRILSTQLLKYTYYVNVTEIFYNNYLFINELFLAIKWGTKNIRQYIFFSLLPQVKFEIIYQ